MSSRVIGLPLPLALVACPILMALTSSALALEPKSYCHDPTTVAQWQKLLSNSPRDPIVIRLYGLRRGLCSMIDDGLVELDQATRIFDREHTRALLERHQEEQERGRELRL